MSVAAPDVLEASPTAMHAVGDAHETPDNAMFSPLNPAGGDWAHEVPFHTSAMRWYGPM